MLDTVESSPVLSPERLSAFLHEVRNPLTTLQTLAKLLQKRMDPQDSNHWIGSSIEQECRYLQSLLLQLESGFEPPTDPTRQRILLPNFLAELAPTFETIANACGLSFDLDIDQSQVWVWADPLNLRQVVSNLIDNACKYTPAPGQISLQLQQQDGSVVIAIHDTGLGILSEDLPHIFERHYRGHPPDSVSGQGLGLAISRSLIEHMGGSLEVNSQWGQGSVFRIRLPIDLEFVSGENHESS